MNISFQVRYLVVFLLCFGAALPSYAQLSTSAALDNNNLLIGDQVVLHLKALAARGESIKDADLSPLEDVEEIEILEVSEWDTLQSPQGLLLQKNVTITSFDSGYYYIPQLAIEYEINGETKESLTPRLALAVNTLPADSLELAPIKEIIEEPFKIEDLVPLLGSILILGLLVLLAAYFWKRRQQGEEVEVEIPEIKRPAHEIALERLYALKAKELWQTGEVKAYHSELTYIVREYLENRYETQALESTTDEILRDLSALGFDDAWKGKLREMLQAADLVKFAKAEPPATFHAQMWDYAEEFVKATQKEEIIEEEQS